MALNSSDVSRVVADVGKQRGLSGCLNNALYRRFVQQPLPRVLDDAADAPAPAVVDARDLPAALARLADAAQAIGAKSAIVKAMGHELLKQQVAPGASKRGSKRARKAQPPADAAASARRPALAVAPESQPAATATRGNGRAGSKQVRRARRRRWHRDPWARRGGGSVSTDQGGGLYVHHRRAGSSSG